MVNSLSTGCSELFRCDKSTLCTLEVLLLYCIVNIKGHVAAETSTNLCIGLFNTDEIATAIKCIAQSDSVTYIVCLLIFFILMLYFV